MPATQPALGRLAAVSEFLGVLVTAIVVQRALLRVAGIPTWKSAQARMLESGEVEFVALARLAAIDQLVKYGALLGLAFAIGWWHRRRRLERYGLTRARRSWRELAGIGVALWSVSRVLPALLLALDDHLPWIGQGPDHWALFPQRWSAGFLLFMAAGSFLLVPIVEELTFRGYLLNRLREDFGEAAALVLSAVCFTLVHTQYFEAEVMSAGMLLSLAIASLAAGYSVVRTGSLVPCIVAHALLNLPTPPGEWSEEIALALPIAVLLVVRRPVTRWARDLGGLLSRPAERSGMVLGLVALVAGLAAVLVLRDRAAAVGAALLAFGLAGDALDRRRGTRDA